MLENQNRPKQEELEPPKLTEQELKILNRDKEIESSLVYQTALKMCIEQSLESNDTLISSGQVHDWLLNIVED